jgi:hypothetical protein
MVIDIRIVGVDLDSVVEAFEGLLGIRLLHVDARYFDEGLGICGVKFDGLEEVGFGAFDVVHEESASYISEPS